MKKTQGRQVDAGVLAVLYRTGTSLHGVIARTDGERPRIVSTRDFAATESSRIDAWLEQAAAAEVIEILPASAVVCRNCVLPEGDPDQLDQAMALQAEIHLGSTPAHRLGMGVLDQAPGETTRTGVIVSWPESAERPGVETDIQVRYAPDVAALAALMDGHRPDEPVIAIDRESGSVALGLAHPGGATLRAARAEMEDDDWPQRVGHLLAETGINSSHSAAFVESIVGATNEALAARAHDNTCLLLPAALRSEAAQHVEGTSSDDRWWERYGLAVGVLLARTGPLAALTSLRAEAPIVKPDPITRVVNRLSKPRTAINIVLLSLAVLAFGPPVFSFARLWILEFRNPDLDAQLARFSDASEARSIYDEIADERWSMTKLLADIACSTPESVELEQIRIDQGESLNVAGTVKPFDDEDLTPQQVVQRMQRQFQATGLFTKVSYQWGKGNNFGIYEFDLSADVKRPHREFDYPVEQDFEQFTLQERKYDREAGSLGIEGMLGRASSRGSSASAARSTPTQPVSTPTRTPSRGSDETITPDPDPDPVDSGSRAERRRPTRDPGSNSGGNSVARGDTTGPGVSAQNQIPPPLTQELVDAMSKSEVRTLMAEVATARKNAKGRDEELYERLSNDFSMLMERLKKRE